MLRTKLRHESSRPSSNELEGTQPFAFTKPRNNLIVSPLLELEWSAWRFVSFDL